MRIALLAKKGREFTNTKITSLLIAVIFSLVIVLTLSATIRAQDAPGFNLSTTPVSANLQTKPGVATTTKIQVRNNNTSAENIKTSVLRFSSNGTDGSPLLSNPDKDDEFLNWVKFSESQFSVEPNVWKTIEVTITPPDSAAFGYYYAVVFSRADNQATNKTTNLTGSVAVPILLDVNAPGEVRKASVTQFKTNRNMFEFLPADFTVKLKNTGNTHVAPRGNIFITKGGKNIGTLEVNQAKGSILPGTTREFGGQWSDGSPAYKLKEADGKVVLKDGKQVSKLSWNNFDPTKVRFGKYHAKVTMVYNDGVSDVPTEAELDFWVIPWRILAVTLLVLLLVGAGVWVLVIRPLRKGIKKLPLKNTNKS